jgi:transposase
MKTMSGSPKIEYDIGEILAYISMLEERIAKLEKEDTQKEKENAQKDVIIAKQAKLIEWYEGQFKQLKRRQFGASSEVMPPDVRQYTLFGELPVTPPPPETEEVTVKRKKRVGKRAEDLADLPVVRTDHELSENERNCPECNEPMRDIGVSIRQSIEIIPAQAILREDATHSYKCINEACIEKEGKQTIVTADAPRALIPGSLASPSLVAHIAYQKYSNGMPLYRLENGFKHDGIHISRQNMASWVIKCVQMYLMVIYLREWQTVC